uniref:ATP synthase F0 subunit 6 n=1 Tax=Asemonea sichuanensis TaxID=426804 RepID=UPI001FAF576A|nr:ATP synthase F0 subunit 6 [Asemonea sichuanensis]ULX45813.1 ATP synthase F0 subunit 6 [Asemonea sichuanensis]
MMMNLFSVFDPTSYFGFSLNWMVMMLIFIFIPIKYYLINGNMFMFFIEIFMKIYSLFKSVSIPNYMAMSFMCVMMFIYLAFSNLFGLFPFIFTSTAHPFMTLGIGFIMWYSFFLMGWFMNFKMSAAHLVPEGSPMGLAPLMVIIESISHLIRPFTLSIRLAANMMAGHLIIGLISSISGLGILFFGSSIFLQVILLILEFGVAIIQGFVFSILLLLYALEYY